MKSQGKWSHLEKWRFWVFFPPMWQKTTCRHTHFHRTKIETNSEPMCLEESCRRKSTSQGTNRSWPGSANQLNADLTALWIPTWAGQRIITAFCAGVHWSQEPWGRFTSCSELFPPSVLVVIPQNRPFVISSSSFPHCTSYAVIYPPPWNLFRNTLPFMLNNNVTPCKIYWFQFRASHVLRQP